MDDLRVLELYSGIGGMHHALKESGVGARVVAAVDINTSANHIYTHNFPSTPLWNRTIEGITLDDFNRLSADVILMSPPCQPFTRLGLQGDLTDARTKSFLYILDLLPRLSKRPRFFLLENVKGFETSSAREHLVATLTKCGYTFQEVMVSPTSIGIPNSRLRYFMLAKLSSEQESAALQQPAVGQMSCNASATCQPPEGITERHVLYKLETTTEVQRKMIQNSDLSVSQIQDFLQQEQDFNMDDFLLPPKTLLRYAMILDIVQPSCRRSVCFTKGYGRYVEGTGSVLQCSVDTQVESVFTGLEQLSEEQKVQQLSKLKLRYFTPREVANLMGFPPSFSFPEQIPIKQRYKVLGNSLNVVVVAKLLQQLLS